MMVSGLKVSWFEALPTATTHTFWPPAVPEAADAKPLVVAAAPAPETSTLIVVPCTAGTAPLATMPPPALATPDALAAAVETPAAACPARLMETVLADWAGGAPAATIPPPGGAAAAAVAGWDAAGAAAPTTDSVIAGGRDAWAETREAEASSKVESNID